MPTEPRAQHPFHMYNAVMAQPQAFAEISQRTYPLIEQIAPRLAQARRIFIVAIGTSFHAAQIGYHLFRYYPVVVPTQTIHAFDFALYGPDLSPADAVIVISHRGGKRYSLESIKRAREAGCYTLLITGEGMPSTMQYADTTINTTEQDKSSAHTVSYTGAIAVLSCLAEFLGQQHHAPTFLQEELPAILRTCLATDAQMAALASAHLHHRRLWIVGGGPSAITAQEIALKIKETSYLQAEGMPVEVQLHGPLQCVESEDLFILIAPAGPAQARILELAAMIKAIGASILVISDGTATSIQQDGANSCNVPPVPEPFTALTCLIPLQLFSYHLALACGTDPDGFRLEDPRFAQASKLIQL
ncbi:MAG TPA: SIS domain-containing protein [Ktedonobacteraceae bacterium]|nr:SIS domain-containing protein [Ktedonobacteraceae bacterium]